VAVEVEFGGADEFRALGKRLEDAGGKGVITEAIGHAVQSFLPQMRAAVAKGAERLPKRGGLAARVARTNLSITVTNKNGVYSAKVKALPNAVADPAALNRGRAGHPVYGRKPNVYQKVPPGWFSDPLKVLRPQIAAAITAAVEQALRKI
jgi:hypothetical protein